MEIVNEFDLYRQKKEIEKFQQSFSSEFGYTPEIILPRIITFKGEPPTQLVDIENVINEFIPKKHRAYYNSIISRSRNREICELRMIFCKIGYDLGYKLTTMGRYCCRNHATIIYNIRVANDLISNNKAFLEKYTIINEILTEKQLNNTKYGKSTMPIGKVWDNTRPNYLAVSNK